MSDSIDRQVLRDLAKQVAGIAAQPIQDQRRQLWRQHNSLIRTRPLVIVTAVFCWHEIDLEGQLQCTDPLLRRYEDAFRKTIFSDAWGDDRITEPWIQVPAVPAAPHGDERWGPTIKRIPCNVKGGAWMFDPPIRTEADFDKLVAYPHAIDEDATARNLAKVQDAVGDILTVAPSRKPVLEGWRADISTDLARLRGLEQVMWDMVDNPAFLHRLCAFMRDAVLQQHDQAEAAGDWRICNHSNQAMPYATELADPRAGDEPVGRQKLWGFFAAQEMAMVSPAMHDEFILQYQLPIMAKFGLMAYGCCEDLTNKIDMLRQIKNLRRIAVTPWADVGRCAEQIGQDYVMSWRPSPAEMICTDWKPDLVGKVVREAMEAAKGCHIDITLKDVQTVQNDFGRFPKWVKIVREITDEYA